MSTLRRMLLIGCILTLLPVSIYAQAYKNIASVRLGLSSEMMMDFNLDYHYMFNKFIGVGGGLFLNHDFGQVKMPYGDISSPEGSVSWVSETKVTKPGISISALGQIGLFKIKERSVMLELEPSWLLSIPREAQILRCQYVRSEETYSDKVSASGGQWTAWLMRAGFSFCLSSHCSVGISYNITNFDSFSTARLMEYKGTKFDKFYEERKPVIHSVDIGLNILF